MRDEDEIRAMADSAADEVAAISGHDVLTETDEQSRERLRAVRAALDWALGDSDDSPVYSL